VVERRNTIPILANVLLRAGKSSVELKATDLDLEIVETAPGEAPAHMIHDIVRKLPEGAQVELQSDADGTQLQVRAGRSKFTLQALPETDFPDLAAGEMSHSFSIASADLKRLIDRTQFAISTEETRYYLNGIYFHAIDAGGDKLRAVATDGHRLAQAEIAAPKGAKGMPGIIVPRKTVAEVQRLIDDAGEEVKVELSATKIPDRRHLPGLCPRDSGRKRQDAHRRQERIHVGGRSRLYRFERARPRCEAPIEELEVEYGAEALDIGFNGRYLLDILQQVGGEKARLKLADPGSPTLIEDMEGDGALYVLMPMRV